MVSMIHIVRPTKRSLYVLRRNIRVWQKLIVVSLLGNFAEPLLYLAAIGYGLGQYVGEIAGLPYVTFLATGVICSTAMNTASFEGMYSAYTRMAVQKTWESMLMTPLVASDIVFGEILWIGFKTTINATCIMLVMVLLGILTIDKIFLVLPVIYLVGLCFGAMALIMTSVSQGYDFFVYYFTLMVTPMMLLSGVFFPFEALPTAVQYLMGSLPLYHAVEVIRPLLLGIPVEAPLQHLGVIMGFFVVAYFVSVFRIHNRLMK